MVRLGKSVSGREPSPCYRLLIVQPNDPNFEPDDWRVTPGTYRVVSDEGPRRFRGKVDAFRFQHNKDAMTRHNFERWAIAVHDKPNGK